MTELLSSSKILMLYLTSPRQITQFRRSSSKAVSQLRKYSYWRSSKSLLFTGGWGQFIKMYKLKPGDRVFFFRCAYAEDVGVKEFYMIDVHQNNLDFSAIGLNGEKEMDARESSNSEGQDANMREGETALRIVLFGVQIG
ncbi:AP2/ERF and B3 domain-containing transcription factor [Quillaja saponaria]|uniref:AP2/ERF and B3 domain-containing transcription factor n=1 Tax=Quillaja saponaria TaxID=32244 RepID=A0AAD7KT55_QUISA|nr:AP2/ERF and B3 domain-containing transcription factor [Quillaja saponaria]